MIGFKRGGGGAKRSSGSASGSGAPSAHRAKNWKFRACLAVVCLVIGGSSVAGSLARVVDRAAPSQAFAIDGANGVIAASYAEQEFRQSPSADVGSKPDILARQALIADPTVAEAVNVLALQAQLRSEPDVAQGLFEYSLLLSRRELSARVWAIEEAVERGDIATALSHYDFALRTSSRAEDVLLPNLIAALSQPAIRAELLKTFANEPPWGTKFLSEASVKAQDPEAVLAFFEAGQSGEVLPLSDAPKAYLVNNLFSAGKIDAAWDYYSQYQSGAVATRSRDEAFQYEADARSVFDWQPSVEDGFSVNFLNNEEAGGLDFAVQTGKTGLVVQQRQVLPQGTYRLAGVAANVDAPDRARPYWLLQCTEGQELARIEIPAANNENARFSGAFTVPQGCAAQTLSLIARASDRVSGVSGQMLSISIAPAASAASPTSEEGA